jgi:hypothetical protein
VANNFRFERPGQDHRLAEGQSAPCRERFTYRVHRFRGRKPHLDEISVVPELTAKPLARYGSDVTFSNMTKPQCEKATVALTSGFGLAPPFRQFYCKRMSRPTARSSSGSIPRMGGGQRG